MHRFIGLLILGVMIFIYSESVLAWNATITHQDLSAKAAEYSVLSPPSGDYLRKLGFLGSLDELLILNGEQKSVKYWIRFGSKEEDDLLKLSFLNHFHNPLLSWDQAGLNTPAPLFNGISSLLWAQQDPLQTPHNEWTWQRARVDYYNGLTSSTNIQRQESFAKTFQGLGHLIHLIQDMAQPAHVRNDAHPLDDVGVVPGFENWAWSDQNLDDVALFMSAPKFPTIPLTTRVEGYLPVSRLWDVDPYNGNYPSAGTDVGLAEYTNANFFSEDTIDSIDFPYPSLTMTQVVDRNYVRDSGDAYTRHYYFKTQEGETNNGQGYLLAAVDWLECYRQTYPAFGLFLPKISVLDGNVYKDYSSLLLPRAVGYSAKLIDHFFEDQIEITPPDRFVYSITGPGPNLGFTEIRLKARNIMTTGEELTDGSIHLVVKYRLALEDPFQSHWAERTPNFYYIVAPVQNGVKAIPRGDTPVELVFALSQTSIPLWATDVSFHIAYRGVLGNETDGVAVGFKDISEPTPVNVVNNMDYVCINGNYYVAGSVEALTAVDTNGDGIPNEADIYPHGLSNIYVKISALTSTEQASSTNYTAWFSSINPGFYGRIFLLTDYAFNVNIQETLVHLDEQDGWGWVFMNDFFSWPGLKNQEEWINGVFTRFYPNIPFFRGIRMFDQYRYQNPGYPSGTVCSADTLSAPLSGPVEVTLP